MSYGDHSNVFASNGSSDKLIEIMNTYLLSYHLQMNGSKQIAYL